MRRNTSNNEQEVSELTRSNLILIVYRNIGYNEEYANANYIYI